MKIARTGTTILRIAEDDPFGDFARTDTLRLGRTENRGQ